MDEKTARGSLLHMSLREFLALSSIVCYLSFTIFSSSEFANYLTFNTVIRLFLPITLALSLLSIVIEYRDTYAVVAISAACAAVFLVSAVASSSMTLCIGFVVVLAARASNRARVMRVVFVMLLCGMALVIISSLIGVIPNVTVSTISSGSLVERHRLGFNHQNTLGGFAFAGYVCWVYLKGMKPTIKDIVVSLVVCYVLYVYVNTKTAALLILAILSFRIVSKLHIRDAVISVLCLAFIIGSLVIGIALPYLYSPVDAEYSLLNSFLTGRLELASRCVEQYELTLFGQQMQFVSSNDSLITGATGFVVDNAFVHLLYHYGFAPTTIIYLFYSVELISAWRNRDSLLLVLFAAVFMSAIMENWFFNPSMNSLLFLLFARPPAIASVAGGRGPSPTFGRVGAEDYLKSSVPLGISTQ